jgi:hypothetical protein
MRLRAGRLRLLLYGGVRDTGHDQLGFTTLSGGQTYVSRSTKEGARARRNRTRATITTAAACLVAAAFAAGPAQAAIVPSAVDPNTTLPNSFTDEAGIELGLCTNTGCAGVRPDQSLAVAVPGNFFADAEAFWFLSEVTTPSGGFAEFAVEAAFEDLAPNQGGAFTRQRFRFDNLTGTVRITTPFGSKVYPGLEGGTRSINDTTDLGLVGGCLQPVGTFCDYAGANYGPALTHFLMPEGFDPAGAAPGEVIVHNGRVVGSPTGYNGVKVEHLVGTDPITQQPVWELVEEETDFAVEFQMASAPADPIVFASVNATSVDFPGRRSDESSGTKKVRVKNDGAAPMDISAVTLSGDNAASFSATGCVGTLQPGANCDVTVGFTGTSVGTHEATLTVANNSVNAPSLQVPLSGLVTGLATPPAQPAPAGGNTTVIQVIPGAGAGAAAAPSQGVLPSTVQSLRVSRLSLARRISLTRLRLQGLRASMRLPQGTNVVRIAVYKARHGQKTGRALFSSRRSPRSAGLYRVTLRDRSLLRKLRAGSYVLEVQAGQSAASLGRATRIAFTVTR